MAEVAREPWTAAFRGFSRQFWVVNGVEMLERAAWYGGLAVFILHLNRLGYSDEIQGLLSALLLTIPYVVPMISSPLSEKLGYRPVLALAFLVYGAGLALLATSTSPSAIIAAIALWGVGAGLFKPIPVSTIGHIAGPEVRNRAYQLFYWSVNIGAFLGPLVIGLYFQEYLSAFAFTAAVIGLSLILTVFAYRNPRPPERDVEIGRQFRKLAEIARDRPFLILVAIYSGFWFMYAMNFTWLLRYLQDFVALPAGFNEQLFQTINPFVIIGFGVLVLVYARLGKALDNFPALMLMTVGITIYVGGVLAIGFSPFFVAAVAGVVVYTVGEFLTHPGFLSYVSKIASPDRMAVYQSFGFLPIALGLFTGPTAGGILYGALATRGAQPQFFWAVVAAVGLLTIAAFLLYNLRYGPKKEERPAPVPAVGAAAKRGSFLTGPASVGLVLLLVPALVLAGAFSGTTRPKNVLPGEDGDGTRIEFTTYTMDVISGTTLEGQTTVQRVRVPQDATGNVTFTLAWTDEAAGSLPGTGNAPDRFQLIVKAPTGDEVTSEEVANPSGAEGKIVLKLVGPAEGAGGEYEVRIRNVESGDITLGPAAIGVSQDTGNAWSLTPQYQAPRA